MAYLIPDIKEFLSKITRYEYTWEQGYHDNDDDHVMEYHPDGEYIKVDDLLEKLKAYEFK